MASDENSADATATARERFEAVERHLTADGGAADIPAEGNGTAAGEARLSEEEEAEESAQSVAEEEDMESDALSEPSDDNRKRSGASSSQVSKSSLSDLKSDDDEVGP